jgi:hypothetical protein
LIRAYRLDSGDRRRGDWQEVAAVRTDARGAYEIAGLPAESIALVPVRPPEVQDGSQIDRGLERPPELDWGWPWVVRLDAGESALLDLEVQFPARAWLSGTVSVNGEPLPGLPLTFRPKDGRSSAGGRSGLLGRYRFRFEGEGRYELAVPGGPLATSVAVELQEGVDQSIDLELSAGEVRGRVALSEVPPEIRVRLELKQEPVSPDEHPQFQWTEQWLVTPAEDGSFRFAEAPAGIARVVAHDGSKRLAAAASDAFRIEAGRIVEVPELRLPPGSRLTAVLQGPSGVKLPFATLELRAAPGAVALPERYDAWFVGDSATVFGLPPGRLIARVRPHGDFRVSDEQVVELHTEGSEGSAVTLMFQVTRENR